MVMWEEVRDVCYDLIRDFCVFELPSLVESELKGYKEKYCTTNWEDLDVDDLASEMAYLLLRNYEEYLVRR